MLGIFLLAEQVLAYQDVLGSTELVPELWSRIRKHGSTKHNLAVII
jgi:hypothetical protein